MFFENGTPVGSNSLKSTCLNSRSWSAGHPKCKGWFTPVIQFHFYWNLTLKYSLKHQFSFWIYVFSGFYFPYIDYFQLPPALSLQIVRYRMPILKGSFIVSFIHSFIPFFETYIHIQCIKVMYNNGSSYHYVGYPNVCTTLTTTSNGNVRLADFVSIRPLPAHNVRWRWQIPPQRIIPFFWKSLKSSDDLLLEGRNSRCKWMDPSIWLDLC